MAHRLSCPGDERSHRWWFSAILRFRVRSLFVRPIRTAVGTMEMPEPVALAYIAGRLDLNTFFLPRFCVSDY